MPESMLDILFIILLLYWFRIVHLIQLNHVGCYFLLLILFSRSACLFEDVISSAFRLYRVFFCSNRHLINYRQVPDDDIFHSTQLILNEMKLSIPDFNTTSATWSLESACYCFLYLFFGCKRNIQNMRQKQLVMLFF